MEKRNFRVVLREKNRQVTVTGENISWYGSAEGSLLITIQNEDVGVVAAFPADAISYVAEESSLDGESEKD